MNSHQSCTEQHGISGDFLDKTASLMPTTQVVVCEKATERPQHRATSFNPYGSFLCRRCGLALFRTRDEFQAHCGWPAFDEEIAGSIREVPDADGMRTEICCHRCDAHLGHVFLGEYLTPKNKRFCVNACAIDEVSDDTVVDTEEAIIAGGCFWGIEYFMKQLLGVIRVEVGYSGGVTPNPTYEQVCQGSSGHYEAVRVVFDRNKISYRDIIQHFFEIHDPTQKTGQGPDIGTQYRSAIFYYNETQRLVSETLMDLLVSRGYLVATVLKPVQIFWPAEAYHQNYYSQNQKKPYCHRVCKRFE
jgi:peptide methionine sulfoxide reductase msrA/msrB